jgi:hypothetical protein
LDGQAIQPAAHIVGRMTLTHHGPPNWGQASSGSHRRNTDPNPPRPARHPRERSGLDVPGVAGAFVYKDFVKEK